MRTFTLFRTRHEIIYRYRERILHKTIEQKHVEDYEGERTEQAAEHLVAELVGVNAAGRVEVEEQRRAVGGERADGGQVAEVVEVLGSEAEVDCAHWSHWRGPVRPDAEVRVERRTPHALGAATATGAAEQTVAWAGAHLLVADHLPIVESKIAFQNYKVNNHEEALI